MKAKLTELDKLRSLLAELRRLATGTAYLTPKRILDLLEKLGLSE